MVARAVVTGDPRPIEAEDDGQPVQADVEVHLVPGPVEERRVQGDDRSQALRCAIPAATVTACCSAMPTSKNRSG